MFSTTKNLPSFLQSSKKVKPSPPPVNDESKEVVCVCDHASQKPYKRHIVPKFLKHSRNVACPTCGGTYVPPSKDKKGGKNKRNDQINYKQDPYTADSLQQHQQQLLSFPGHGNRHQSIEDAVSIVPKSESERFLTMPNEVRVKKDKNSLTSNSVSSCCDLGQREGVESKSNENNNTVSNNTYSHTSDSKNTSDNNEKNNSETIIANPATFPLYPMDQPQYYNNEDKKPEIQQQQREEEQEIEVDLGDQPSDYLQHEEEEYVQELEHEDIKQLRELEDKLASLQLRQQQESKESPQSPQPQQKPRKRASISTEYHISDTQPALYELHQRQQQQLNLLNTQEKILRSQSLTNATYQKNPLQYSNSFFPINDRPKRIIENGRRSSSSSRPRNPKQLNVPHRSRSVSTTSSSSLVMSVLDEMSHLQSSVSVPNVSNNNMNNTTNNQNTKPTKNLAQRLKVQHSRYRVFYSPPRKLAPSKSAPTPLDANNVSRAPTPPGSKVRTMPSKHHVMSNSCSSLFIDATMYKVERKGLLQALALAIFNGVVCGERGETSFIYHSDLNYYNKIDFHDRAATTTTTTINEDEQSNNNTTPTFSHSPSRKNSIVKNILPMFDESLKPISSPQTAHSHKMQFSDFDDKAFQASYYNNGYSNDGTAAEQRLGLNPKEARVLFDEVCHFSSSLFCVAGEINSKTAIITCIYLDRLIKASRCSFCLKTWKRLLLASMMMSSKMFDDQAVWNADYVSVLPFLPLDDANQLERAALKYVEYNLNVPFQLYAEYYFDLRELLLLNKRQHLETIPALDKDTAVKLKALPPCDCRKFQSKDPADDVDDYLLEDGKSSHIDKKSDTTSGYNNMDLEIYSLSKKRVGLILKHQKENKVRKEKRKQSTCSTISDDSATHNDDCSSIDSLSDTVAPVEIGSKNSNIVFHQLECPFNTGMRRCVSSEYFARKPPRAMLGIC